MSKSPTSASSAAIVCTGLAFAWPDGTPVFEDFPLAVGPGRTGLIGLNGSGKSTLLKLIAGELDPDRRAASRVAGEVGYLPQNVTLDTAPAGRRGARHRRARAPRCTPSRRATRARSTSPPSATTGTSRSAPAPPSTSSGSATSASTAPSARCRAASRVLLRLAALLLRRPDVLLLDEPTNNLDLDARQAAVRRRSPPGPGVMVVVSHDRELLDLVDQIADLRDGEVRWYGGNFTRVRGGARRRAGGGRAHGARRRGRRAAAEARTGRRPGQVGPAQAATARRCTTPSASRRSSWARASARPRSPRASTASCTTEKLAEAQGAARRGGGGGPGRRRDPRRPAAHRGAAGPDAC